MPMHLGPDSVPSLDGRVVGELADNEAVLLFRHRREVKILNELGSRTWQLVDGTRSVNQIAEILSRDCGMPLPVVLADTLAFLDELVDLGAVSSDPPAARQPEPNRL